MIKTIKIFTVLAFVVLFTNCGKDDKPLDPYQVGEVPAWQVDNSKFEHSMQLIATLSYKDFAFENENDMLGAFVNDECVGYAGHVVKDSCVQDIFMLSVFGNTSGDEVTFKMYDAANGRLIPADNVIEFVPSGMLGSISEPLLIICNN